MQDEAGARTALVAAPGRLGSDPHDFAGLYIRHRSSFTSHARRYLRDPRDADEVVQEAFLRLFLAMPELETELQALAYCRRTITNLCIDRYRADARRPRLVALDGPTVDELAEDDTGDPVVRAEDAALVREALSRLPALHRAALVKREIEEKPLPVIADELDVAEDSVKHLLFRARRALRKMLVGTSVAPGAATEVDRGLRPVGRGASGGLAGLLLLALLGLGSGPDLRAVPVVGVDLPDVLGVTVVAEVVGDAVRSAARVVLPGDEADDAAVMGAPSSRADERVTSVPSGGAATSDTATSDTVTGGTVTGGGATDGAVTGGGVSTRPPVGASGLPVEVQPPSTISVVDGVPVVSPLPPAALAPGTLLPAADGRTIGDAPSTGRAGGLLLPVGVPPLLEVPGRALPPPTTGTSEGPSRAAVPGAPGPVRRADDARQARAAEPPVAVPPAVQVPQVPAGTQERTTRKADKGAGKAQKADKGAGKAQKADKAAGKAQKADKAPVRAAAPPERASSVAQPVVTSPERPSTAPARTVAVPETASRGPARPAHAVGKPVEQAQDRAERAAVKAERTAQRVVEAPSDAAQRAAEKAAAKAAERAAAKAAELAAARAAAEQSAAASVPVSPSVAVP